VSFLLDTNLVSEWVKPRPNPGVVAWMAEVDEDRVFISVITLAELRYGIERLAAGQRRKRLGQWLEEELPLRFEGRVLAVDAFVADACGRITARAESLGRRMEIADGFIAATAETRQFTVVTCDVSPFSALGMKVLNPWT